jgi:polysaccharide export outer membrane protein
MKYYISVLWIVISRLKLIVFFASLFLVGCIPPDEILYFNNGNFDSTSLSPGNLKCQQGDLLEVKVFSINREVVAPFNNFLNEDAKEGNINPVGYLVDETQSIVLPLIGKLEVGGQSLTQIERMIAQELMEYVKDAVVSVHLLNFKVTVLGEVGRPGVVTISNARANLLEVLGYAGDITIFGEREDIIVVRQTEGKMKEFHLDITDKNIFYQEGFALHQNDVIYVAPNASKRQTSLINPMRTSLLLAASTLIGTLLITLFLK